MSARRRCGWGGLGLVGDLSHLPKSRTFEARCSCGARVTVTDGRIPFHFVGEDASIGGGPTNG